MITEVLARGRETRITEQSLILPNSKRELLLEKLNGFKTHNLNARELGNYKKLAKKTCVLFINLCWSHLGQIGRAHV